MQPRCAKRFESHIPKSLAMRQKVFFFFLRCENTFAGSESTGKCQKKTLRKSCDVGLFLRSSDAKCLRFGLLPLRLGLRCEHPRCEIASDVGRAMRTTKLRRLFSKTEFYTTPPLEAKIATDTLNPFPAPVVYKISGPKGEAFLYTTGAEDENSAAKFSKESVPPVYKIQSPIFKERKMPPSFCSFELGRLLELFSRTPSSWRLLEHSLLEHLRLGVCSDTLFSNTFVLANSLLFRANSTCKGSRAPRLVEHLCVSFLGLSFRNNLARLKTFIPVTETPDPGRVSEGSVNVVSEGH